MRMNKDDKERVPSIWKRLCQPKISTADSHTIRQVQNESKIEVNPLNPKLYGCKFTALNGHMDNGNLPSLFLASACLDTLRRRGRMTPKHTMAKERRKCLKYRAIQHERTSTLNTKAQKIATATSALKCINTTSYIWQHDLTLSALSCTSGAENGVSNHKTEI